MEDLWIDGPTPALPVVSSAALTAAPKSAFTTFRGLPARQGCDRMVDKYDWSQHR